MTRMFLLWPALLLVACVPVQGPPAPGAARAAGGLEDRLVDLVNRHRQSVGCGPLAWHAGAAGVAESHSRDMAVRDYLGHETPEGLSPFDRLTRAGARYRMAAENIAAGPATAEAVWSGWLRSPPHRRNIENCAYTHHGVGEYRQRWTHILLSPL